MDEGSWVEDASAGSTGASPQLPHLCRPALCGGRLQLSLQRPDPMSDGVVLRANLWLPDAAQAGALPDRPHGHRLQQGHRQPDRPGSARARAASRPPTRRSPTRATRSCCSTTAAPARARASGTRGASARRSTTRRCSTGSRRSRGPTARSRPPAARTWASPRCSSPRPTPSAWRPGKPRAVKAVWADVPMSDAYRDVTFHGGAIDAGFIPLWLGLTTSLSALPPSTMARTRPAPPPTWADHLATRWDFAGAEARRHLARRGRRLRRRLLPAALAGRPRRPARDPGRGHGRLVGHLPARRAAALRAARELAEQEALHVAALPHRRRARRSRTRSSRTSGSTAG